MMQLKFWWHTMNNCSMMTNDLATKCALAVAILGKPWKKTSRC